MANATTNNTTPSHPSPSTATTDRAKAHQKVHDYAHTLINTRIISAECKVDWVVLATKHQEQICLFKSYSQYQSISLLPQPISLRFEELVARMIEFDDQEADCGVELLRSVADSVESLWGKKALTGYRWHVKAITGRFLPIELLRMIARILYPWAHQLPYAVADSEDEAAGGRKQ